jgi:predicted phosphodiesterase
MKLAVLSDIHGNLPALRVILDDIDRWAPDRVIVNGDVVNRGPWPAESLRLMLDRHRQQGWDMVRGNHEDYVVSSADPDLPSEGPLYEMRRNAHWTYGQLQGRVAPLAAMPFRIAFPGPDGREVVLVHGSVHSNRDSILPDIGNRELKQKMGGLPALFATAHTHRPFVRRVEGALVVNSGSVGMTFDGDERAGYAQLTWRNGEWQGRLIRRSYDRQAAIRGFYTQGFLREGGALARVMLRELELSRALVYAWHRQYGQDVLDGQIDIDRAVDCFLSSVREGQR